MLKLKGDVKEEAENFDTVKNIMKRINDNVSKAQADLSACKEEEGKLKDEIVKDIHEVVERDNSSVLESLQPAIQQDYKTLKVAFKQENEENEQLFKQLLTLRKECTSMKLQVSECNKKMIELEADLVGQQINSAPPGEDFD